MTLESQFHEFFEELGGIDNLRLMVNLRNVEYGNSIHFQPAVTFTVGWDRRVTFSVVKHRSYFSPPIDEKYYYYLYINEYCWRLRRPEIKTCLSDLIKYHTGNEIFF